MNVWLRSDDSDAVPVRRRGLGKSSSREFRPLPGSVGQGFLTTRRRLSSGRRKGEAMFDREVYSGEARKMVKLVTVPRTQEGEQT